MNKLISTIFIVALLIGGIGFVLAEDDDDLVASVSASIANNPFIEPTDASIGVDDALDDYEVDDDSVDSVLSEDNLTVHTLTYGQGHLVSENGKISLINGFWNTFDRENLSRGKGYLKIGGSNFVLKAQSSIDTKKEFQLYRGNSNVGSVTFTRTASSGSSAVWDVSATLTIGDEQIDAEGVYATITRRVTRSDDKEKDDRLDEEAKQAREQAREESKLIEEQAKEARKIERKWWKFWVRESQTERSGSNAESD